MGPANDQLHYITLVKKPCIDNVQGRFDNDTQHTASEARDGGKHFWRMLAVASRFQALFHSGISVTISYRISQTLRLMGKRKSSMHNHTSQR